MQLKLANCSFQCPHFGNTGFFQEVQPQFFTWKTLSLHHFGKIIDDIDHIVTLVVDDVDTSTSIFEVCFETWFENIVDQVWMWLITYFENVVFGHFSKPCVCCLQVIESIPHVSLSCEYNCFCTLFIIINFLLFHDFLNVSKNLLVSKLCESDNCASRLNRLNNLVAVVACKCKPSSARVLCHDHPKCLLSWFCHWICFIKYDYLVCSGWHYYFLVSETLDLLSHYIDSSFVWCIELQDTVFHMFFKHLPCHAHDWRCFSCAWGSL